jgi:hypothetical protein
MAKIKVGKNGKMTKANKKAAKRLLAADPRTPVRRSRESALGEGAQRTPITESALAGLENHELGDLLATAAWPLMDAGRIAMVTGRPAPMSIADFLAA